MDILSAIHEENEAFVKNRNFAGVKKIIVDNYSDSAHFVYELLQNADDAKATEIKFELQEDSLVITHNGTIFCEKDLRGICSISMGTKSDDYTKIGRFGIGFKAVFVYTNSPQIYSGEYQFEIEELILPRKRECEFNRDKEMTVFVLPFNNPKTIEKAYDQIESKLLDISEDAILFLSNIEKIEIDIEGRYRSICRVPLEDFRFAPDSICEEVKIEIDDEDEYIGNRYYRMKKTGINLKDTDEEGNPVSVKNQSVMVAFPIEDDEIVPVSKTDNSPCYFVFFPTKIQTDFEYMIHAPFVTKSSRETIASNNEANEQLMKNIGILVADSLIALAFLKKLTIDKIDEIFFDYYRNNVISTSFKEQLVLLLETNQKIIPCNDGKCRDIDNVIFTEENDETLKKIIRLFEKAWLCKYAECQSQFDFCRIDNSSGGFLELVDKHFEYSYLSIEHLFKYMEASEYEKHDTKWFVEFVELLVHPTNYGGYRVCVDADLREFPLVRLANYSHSKISDISIVYTNNGSLDEEVLRSKAVSYIYQEIFKIKEYSVELEEAVSAINDIVEKEAIYSFENHIQMVKKIVVAIDNKKITIEEIKNKAILYAANQCTSETRMVKPSDAKLGMWEKYNLNLYVIFQGLSIELLDKRYDQYFSNGDLKKLGCIEGVKQVADMFFFNRSAQIYGATYIHAPWGRANNHNFKPYFQIENMEKAFQSQITLKKSIEIMKLVGIYSDQIKDWLEWSSRQDYSSAGSVYGQGERYSAFGYLLVQNEWLYGIDGCIYKPADIVLNDLQSEYKKYISIELSKKLGFKEAISEKLVATNEKLEKDGMFAISLEERVEYEEFKREKEKKRNKAAVLESNRHSLSEEMEVFEDIRERIIERGYDYDEYNSVSNKERREAVIKEEMDIDAKNMNALNDNGYVLTKKRTVDPHEKAFLNSEYVGKCQICSKKIKTRENKNLFNAVNLIETSKLKKEFRSGEYIGWNSLCLCPNCTAEYKHGVVSMSGFWAKVKTAVIENKSREPFHFEIMMQGENKILTYSPKHLHNLQIAISFLDTDTDTEE